MYCTISFNKWFIQMLSIIKVCIYKLKTKNVYFFSNFCKISLIILRFPSSNGIIHLNIDHIIQIYWCRINRSVRWLIKSLRFFLFLLVFPPFDFFFVFGSTLSEDFLNAPQLLSHIYFQHNYYLYRVLFHSSHSTPWTTWTISLIFLAVILLLHKNP